MTPPLPDLHLHAEHSVLAATRAAAARERHATNKSASPSSRRESFLAAEKAAEEAHDHGTRYLDALSQMRSWSAPGDPRAERDALQQAAGERTRTAQAHQDADKAHQDADAQARVAATRAAQESLRGLPIGTPAHDKHHTYMAAYAQSYEGDAGLDAAHETHAHHASALSAAHKELLARKEEYRRALAARHRAPQGAHPSLGPRENSTPSLWAGENPDVARHTVSFLTMGEASAPEKAEKAARHLALILATSPLFSALDAPHERLRFVRTVLGSWAASCGGTPLSGALQIAAHHEFGVPLRDLAQNDRQTRSLLTHAHGHYALTGTRLRALLRALYEETQADLASYGVTHLVLYRALSWRMTAPPGWVKHLYGQHEGEIALSPLSSWTAHRQIAEKQAQQSDQGLILTVTAPAPLVLSTGRTGLGAWPLGEVVLCTGGGRALLEFV